MNLYAGKMLVVDLTRRRVTTEPLHPEWRREYWGGWGLALRYYWEAVTPTVDPLSPENAIVIMSGVLSGTTVPLTSRLSLVSKSPHTGTIFESNVGGAFGPELKFAGYDGIIITGRADSPLYLKICDDQVSLESAEGMAGMGIFDTEKALEAAIGTPDAKTLAIGPAAENGITYSIIGSESYRQFGRGGAGALFGSKNLKGIVCRGTGGITVADLPAFLERVEDFTRTNLLTEDNLWAESDGTPILVEVTNEMGIHPTRNYTKGFNPKKSGLNSDAIQAAKLGNRACASCPMACGKFTRINNAEVEGPEYETLCLGGSNCDIHDLEPVIRFNRICDDLGLDTMSCGSTISLAMELTESGRHDFGLRFGDAEGYLEVLYEIASLSTERGREIALGAKKLAAKYQAQDLSMEVKGLEMPAYEPRGNYGMGIAYATSERGACHLRAFPVFTQDPFNISALVEEVVGSQNFNGLKWSMCFCDFWGSVNNDICAELLSVGLGEEVSVDELAAAGERIWNLSRLFNLRAGLTAADDTLPKKVLHRPLEDGPRAGRVFAPNDFAEAMQSYYQLRGWDEQGIPSRQKLAELGLEYY
jgi:aldehyde:ferredoxin oxidoreductase